MKPEIVQTFRRLIEVEEIGLNRQVGADMMVTLRNAGAAGRLHSGNAMTTLLKDATNALPIFAKLLLTTVERVCSGHGGPISRENVADVTALVSESLREERRKLEILVTDNSIFKGERISLGNHIKEEFDLAEAVELQRMAAELDLIASTNDNRTDTAKAGDVMVFHGPVGVFQKGAGSTANVHQVLDSGAREHLLAALDRLLTDLDKHGGTLPFNSGEVKELVIDAQAEVKKDKPNMTKLRSVVSGIGTVIEYVPKTKEAYDALKWAGALFGLVMP